MLLSFKSTVEKDTLDIPTISLSAWYWSDNALPDQGKQKNRDAAVKFSLIHLKRIFFPSEIILAIYIMC